MKWIVKNGMVYPTCPRCGAPSLIFYGRGYHGYNLLICGSCGKVVEVKTHPNILAQRAYDRRRQKWLG